MNSFGHTGDPARRALSDIDVEMIAIARSRAEAGYYDPADGSVYLVFDGHVVTGDEEEVDPDEQEWVRIDLDGSRERYLDMADFAASVGDRLLAGRLTRALSGSRVFRRFHDVLRSQSDAVTDLWHEFANARTEARAIAWLVENDLCDEAEAAAAIAKRGRTAERALEEIAGVRRSRDTD